MAGDRARAAIRTVLLRLPDDFEMPCRCIIIADASTTEPFYSPLPDDHFWVVVLAGSLCDDSEEEIIGTVAHEIAHCFLNQDSGGAVMEETADRQARAWGFGKEIDVMRRRERIRARLNPLRRLLMPIYRLAV
jgi:hypothetical protein